MDSEDEWESEQEEEDRYGWLDRIREENDKLTPKEIEDKMEERLERLTREGRNYGKITPETKVGETRISTK